VFGSLEWNGWKAWSRNGSLQREDFALAALLWDLGDAAPISQDDAWSSRVLPAGSGFTGTSVVYVDDVEIGLETVAHIVRDAAPQTIGDLYDALYAETRVPDAVKAISVDLNGDNTLDVSPLDVVFLMHGFHAVELPSNTAGYYRLGTPIGRTDHIPNTDVPGTFVSRHGQHHAPGSEVHIRNDGSQPQTVTIRASDGVADAAYPVTLQPGEERVVEFNLPPFDSRILDSDDPLPDCSPDNDALLSITISAPGVQPLETDSCEFAHAVEGSGGEPALTYAITPPDGTIKRPRDASALGDGVYNTTGAGQTSLTKIKRGKTAVYQLGFQNDTVDADTLTLTGCRSTRGFKVSYFDDSTNVTSQVTGSGLSTGALAPGAFEALTLKIKVGKSGPKNKSCLVRARSQSSPLLQDVVIGKVKVKS
jgi:hypothetical protein